MISLIVYGRNDQHGYNSHRRVALSLNAMAEVLTGADDEVLFVDYHTPRGMPTLPEAIEDTLTDRVLALMRVLRVTPEMHAAAVGDRSRLPISEPHARNMAIRRARPGNWILSTNTDMVFVPRGEKSLTDLVAELDGDAYCLPRFEIPEWLWEAVPRNEPQQMIRLLHDWGERIGLDEVTLGHDWILYDAPGDFQLVRRELMEEVHGFDEEMIHGWHVDSNLWKRIYNKIGDIGTLYPHIAGYHTNHNRTLTRLMAAQATGNDLGRFVYQVEHSALPAQADTWGFAGIDVPEMRLKRPDPVPLLQAAASRGSGQQGPLIASDTREQISVLKYDARHILPFALDPLIGGGFPRPLVGYVGINESTCEMLAVAAAALDCPDQLVRGDEAAMNADVVVLDLGIDASTGRGPMSEEEARALIAALGSGIDILSAREPKPTILLINAISGLWEMWVRTQFNLSYGTFHTRVQAAELREVVVNELAIEWAQRALYFISRDVRGLGHCTTVGDAEAFDLSLTQRYAGLATGWESVDEVGAYVGGDVARLCFTTARRWTGPTHVTVHMASWTSIDRSVDPLEVRLTLDDVVLFDGAPPTVPQMVNVHAVVDLDGRDEHELNVTVRTRDGSTYKPRLSGGMQPWLRIGGITLSPERRQTLAHDSFLGVAPGSDAEALLDGIWTKTNPFGAWSLGATGGIRVQVPPGMRAVELELLGHLGRGEAQGVSVTARGASDVITKIPDLSPSTPGDHLIALPEPGADGTIRLQFDPVGTPAETGEVVEFRGIRAVGST